MSFRTALLLFLVVVPFSSCCPPTSMHPLSAPEQAAFDERLQGTWIHESDSGEIGYLHIGKTENHWTQAIATEVDQEGRLDYTVFTMFSTMVGTSSYLNVQTEELFPEIPPDNAGFLIVRYEFPDPNKLSAYYMDEKPLERAIQSGELKGEVTYRKPISFRTDQTRKSPEPGKVIDCIRITDSPERILRFFDRHPMDELFPKKIELIRANARPSS